MPSLKRWRWTLRRLSVMSVTEMAFRGVREVRLAAEGVAIGLGWQPTPGGPPLEAPRLIARLDDALLEEIAAQRAELDAYCEGRIGMFDRTWTVGRTVRWNVDPKTGIEVRLAFGKRIDYRDVATFGDCKTIWELGRFTLAVPLALGYAATANERYVEKLASDLNGWLAQCPFGKGPHWVSSLEVSLRLIAWSLAHEVLRAAGIGDGLFALAADRNALARCLYQHCWFIRSFTSEHSSANNHLIGELTGLLAGAVVFPFQDSSAGWREYSLRRLAAEAVWQVHPDGVSREQALYYHAWVLEYLLLAQALAAHAGTPLPDEIANLTGRMIRFVLATTDPDSGQPPQIGDSDDGRCVHVSAKPADDVYAWLAGFASPPPQGGRARLFADLLGESYPKLVAAIDHPPERPESTLVTTFPDGGYVVLTSPNCRVVFDGGPFGYGPIAAHAHADCLSVNVAFAGLWWLCDPGTYAYHTEPAWRDFFRGTAAHNTLRVDGLEQGEMGGAFLWLRKPMAGALASGVETDGWCWAENEHDGFAPAGVIHRRRVEMDPTGTRLRIIDMLRGAGRHDVDIGFQLHPDLEARLDPAKSSVEVTRGTQSSMTLSFDPALGARVLTGLSEPKAGWYSERLGSKRPAPHLRLSARVDLPRAFVTELEWRTLPDRVAAAAHCERADDT